MGVKVRKKRIMFAAQITKQLQRDAQIVAEEVKLTVTNVVVLVLKNAADAVEGAMYRMLEQVSANAPCATEKEHKDVALATEMEQRDVIPAEELGKLQFPINLTFAPMPVRITRIGKYHALTADFEKVQTP